MGLKPILALGFGIIICGNALHPSKAKEPIFIILLVNVIFVSDEQKAKAHFLISLILLGIKIF